MNYDQENERGVPAEDSRRAIRSKSSPETGSGRSTSIPNAAPSWSESDAQREADADEWDGEQPEEEEIIGYECLGCGNTQASNGWGGRCDACDGLSLEPMYF